MRSLCLRNLNEHQVSWYLENPAYYYVLDLEHQAPTFIKKLKENQVVIYGHAGRRPKNGTWASVCCNGSTSPKVY